MEKPSFFLRGKIATVVRCGPKQPVNLNECIGKVPLLGDYVKMKNIYYKKLGGLAIHARIRQG